ncbi:MAG: ABC transporter ATP-binding protein [Boseongicola sp.]|nr:ABC transporter ATP-binding protein [Boseongicola sp.]
MPTITLSHVSKSYDSQAPAISDLDLVVQDGEFMCLLGPSGCGKSTTLRVIAGLENLSAGEIMIGGRVLDSRDQGIFVPPEQRGAGLVFQSYALWPHLTVERNVSFGLRLRKVPADERDARAGFVMATLDIEQFRDRYPSQLSGGQQQRVALARMLVIEPDVLLLDEPLSNLDSRLRLKMRAELKRIHGEFGTTIVFVTHDQWEAMTLSTRIAVMNEGSLQQVGTPDEIYNSPANLFVAEFVGNPPINMVPVTIGQDTDLSLTLGEYVTRSFPKIDNVGSVGLRPETIRLTVREPPGNPHCLTSHARVAGILPTGGNWIVELDNGGAPLFVSTNISPEFNVGEMLYFQVDQSRMHLFDLDGIRISYENG